MGARFKLIRELPLKPLTDTELRRVVKQLGVPNFRGVFMRDQLVGKRPRAEECAIVNLDASSGPGTHWVAYSKCHSRSLYYDSFGDIPPPREVQRYLESGGSMIEYNFFPEQSYDTVVCGHLCLKFLIKATRLWKSLSE